jgi:hypothetical protein
MLCFKVPLTLWANEPRGVHANTWTSLGQVSKQWHGERHSCLIFMYRTKKRRYQRAELWTISPCQRHEMLCSCWSSRKAWYIKHSALEWEASIITAKHVKLQKKRLRALELKIYSRTECCAIARAVVHIAGRKQAESLAYSCRNPVNKALKIT